MGAEAAVGTTGAAVSVEEDGVAEGADLRGEGAAGEEVEAVAGADLQEAILGLAGASEADLAQIEVVFVVAFGEVLHADAAAINTINVAAETTQDMARGPPVLPKVLQNPKSSAIGWFGEPQTGDLISRISQQRK